MPHVFAALHPAMGTHVRAPTGARGQVVPARDVVLESRVGREGQAHEETRPGARAGETRAQTRFKATVNWRERGDVHRSAE